jgi:Right handed beta helix region
MGNEHNITAGCVFTNSDDVVMSSTSFSHFKGGAIFSIANEKQSHIIQDCEIKKCGLVGVYLQGVEAKQVVLRTKIDHVNGIGIRIHRGNRSKIKGCEINYCLNGIEVVSADPIILMNHIKQNIENGIVTIAKDYLRCDSTIKLNYI